MTLEFLTSMVSPFTYTNELPHIFYIWAWFVVLAGWILIPTIVAIAVSLGQARIALDEDWEIVIRTILEGEVEDRAKREQLVKAAMNKKEEMFKKYREGRKA